MRFTSYTLRSYSNDEQSIGSGGESRRFKIGKPWIPCLAENKRIWKEQAVRGIWNKILVRCVEFDIVVLERNT